MRWVELKARLLEAGGVRVTGIPIDDRIETSRAGPSAGGPGSVFFTVGTRRIRLGLDPKSPIELTHLGNGKARIRIDDTTVPGHLETVGLHCPRQAYITVSEGCIFRCRYCPVPLQEVRVKTPEEIERLVEGVIDRIDAISLTSGVVGSIEEDEARIVEVVSRLRRFEKPIGVSIYPSPDTPRRLHSHGVAEVKFNIETATEDLFKRLCPGLDRDVIWEALHASVPLFGRNHVFSNVILGLGETDEEMVGCLRELAGAGVIPIVRPLSPAADCADLPRPSARRLLSICEAHGGILKEAGLNPREALTMCVACTGCDLSPGRDT
jgi:biotin synthase-related radical SAM superfamily protein